MENKIEKAVEEFNKYTQNFDLDNEMIKRKYYHTFRVVDYAKDIANSENLDEHDYYIAFICALLHDIARFRQATEFGTYVDGLSFDHGDVGYEILMENDYISKYVSNDEDKKVVLKAVKNHNKYCIEEGLSQKELYFAKLVRDADKLDIMDKQGNDICDDNFEIEEEALSAIKEQRLVNRMKVKGSDLTTIMVLICFMYDMNYNRSMEILEEKQIIKRKLEIIEKYIDKEKFEFVKELILKKIKI